MSNRKVVGDSLWIGGFLVILGLSVFADQVVKFGFYNADSFTSIVWPLIFLFIGLSNLLKKHFIAALIFLMLFTLFEVSILFGWSLWGIFWPFVLIFIGLSIMIGRRPEIKGESKDSVLDEAVFFSGKDVVVKSKEFEYGEFSAIFGGVKVDLRNAEFKNGKAVVEVNAIFGGAEVLIPENCKVVSDVTPIFGGYEDKVSSKSAKADMTLHIKGSAIFGGVEVK
jgi:predicted membrane protein